MCVRGQGGGGSLALCGCSQLGQLFDDPSCSPLPLPLPFGQKSAVPGLVPCWPSQCTVQCRTVTVQTQSWALCLWLCCNPWGSLLASLLVLVTHALLSSIFWISTCDDAVALARWAYV